MTISTDEYPFEYRHSDCGKPVFYLKTKPLAGDMAPVASEVLMPNGEHPKTKDAIFCDHCKKQVDLAIRDVYPRSA